jgi:SAM-dependent methyltransferase
LHLNSHPRIRTNAISQKRYKIGSNNTEIYELIEDIGEEADERILSIIVATSDLEISSSFKTYTIPGDEQLKVTILEDSSLVSAGSTGFRTWSSSLLLLEYISDELRFCELLKLDNNSHVLDLGSGLGLLGIALARKFGCRVSLTDYDERVLARCKDNVERNEIGDLVKVFKLDWSTAKDDLMKIGDAEFDLIISTDTCYDPSLLPLLVDTIKLVLIGSTRFILAASIRNIVTAQKFLALLVENGLGVRELRMTASWFYYDEQANLLRLFEVIKVG